MCRSIGRPGESGRWIFARWADSAEEQGVEDKNPFYKVGDLKASSSVCDGKARTSVSHETARSYVLSKISRPIQSFMRRLAQHFCSIVAGTFAHCCIDNHKTAYLPVQTAGPNRLASIGFNPRLWRFQESRELFFVHEATKHPSRVSPPPSEHRAIAAYLDRETGRIYA
jgi:hypothetical protein